MSVAVQGELAGQPVIILREGTSRRRGRDAQRNNIMAAKIIAEVLRTTLGPRGMDKMLVDGLGDVTITNDGATILDEIDVQHPGAKILVDTAKTQDKEVGDGTTTVVILAGELLKKAEALLDQNVHPTIIVSGYRKASDKALQILRKLGVSVDFNDRETIKKIALTSMHSKSIGIAREHFADIAVDAVRQIAEKRGDKWVADIDQIQTVKKAGESLADTQLIKGIIIDKEVVHSGMPKRVENAKIAILDCPLEIEKTEFSAEIRIRDPSQMKAFLDEETRMLKGMVDKVKASKANVIFTQKGIDDTAQHFLAKEGILAVRRIKSSDMEKLARASGARIITSLDDLKQADLGSANKVEEIKIGDDKMVFVEGCKGPKSVSILIRGGLERMVDEAERAMHDAVSVVSDIIEDNKLVAGGGSVEAEIAKQLHDYAAKVGGREQLAIEAFAESIEIVPRTLAENAGLDPIDIMVSLRAAHEKAKGTWMGVGIFKGEVIDMMDAGIVEPLSVKEQAIRSTVEAVTMILRVDDVIASARPPPGMPPQGPMPGAGPEEFG